VVVRQFSFVVTSLNQPPAGMRSGVERAALSMLSHTGRIAGPCFISGEWLLCVVMAGLLGRPVKQPGGTEINEERSILPGSRSHSSKKKGIPGKAFRRFLLQVMVR
jgi:hypothetical protein